MLQLRQLIIPTRTSHDVYENSKHVRFVNVSYQLKDDAIYVKAVTTTDRVVTLVIYDKSIKLTSQCKAQCSCPDFVYRQVYLFNKRKLLPDPQEYGKIPTTVRPRKSNMYGIMRPCKHLYALAHLLLRIRLKKKE